MRDIYLANIKDSASVLQKEIVSSSEKKHMGFHEKYNP